MIIYINNECPCCNYKCKDPNLEYSIYVLHAGYNYRCSFYIYIIIAGKKKRTILILNTHIKISKF